MNFHHQNRARNPLFRKNEKKQAVQNDPSLQENDIPTPEQLPDWQHSGYHMEELPCDTATPMDEANDEPIGPPEIDSPVPYDYDIDPFGEHAEPSPAPKSQALPDEALPAGEAASQEPDIQETPPVQTVSGPLAPVHTAPKWQLVIRITAVVIAALLLALGIVFYIFRIDEINIVGNERYTADQIIHMTGLKTGIIFLPSSEEDVRKLIEKNRYLYVVSIERGDHSLTIQIHERTPVAYTISHGIYYTLDSHGMVLEEAATDKDLTALVLVDKLSLNRCLPGEYIVMQNSDTLSAYKQLMLEFKALSLFEDVASLNLDDLENLSLYTRDGFFVRLGDATYLHGKLHAMSLVLTELRSKPDTYAAGGTIDVSTRQYPTYSPPGDNS